MALFAGLLVFVVIKVLLSHERWIAAIILLTTVLLISDVLYKRRIYIKEDQKRAIQAEKIVCSSWQRSLSLIQAKARSQGKQNDEETKKSFERLKQDFLLRKENSNYYAYNLEETDKELNLGLNDCLNTIAAMNLMGE